MGLGRTVLGTIGGYNQVTADGTPVAKVAGVTLAWELFAAVSGADVTLPDGQIIKIGEKYCRYGQPIVQATSGTYSGKWGPYDSAAVDGRQTLVRGTSYVVNFTVVNTDPMSDYPEAIEGGRVFLARILQVGTGTASLAAGPTRANLDAAFPGFFYVQ